LLIFDFADIPEPLEQRQQAQLTGKLQGSKKLPGWKCSVLLPGEF